MGSTVSKERLLDLNKKLSRKPSYDEFVEIMNDISGKEKKELGDKYHVWYTASLYQLINELKTDVAYDKSRVVGNFYETEKDVLNKFNKNKKHADILRILYRITGYSEYNNILTNSQD